MSERLADPDRLELLDQFAIETEQHIDQIEPLLLAAEWEAPNAAGVGTLFRCFHSVKGLSRLLEFRGLEDVTHHAETLLGHVRAGNQAFSPTIQDLLLQALDTIRELRAHGIATGQGSAAPPGLLAALAAAAEQGSAGAPPESEGLAVPAAADAPLHDDADTLAYFAEMLAECMPGVAALAGGPGDRMQAEEDRANLSLAAGRLALHGLRERLDRLQDAGPECAIDAVAALIHDAGLLATLLGQDTGADALRERMAPALRRARAAQVALLVRNPTVEPVRRLLRLSHAADPSAAAAALLLAAIETAPWPTGSDLPEAVDGVLAVLADGLSRPGGDSPPVIKLFL